MGHSICKIRGTYVDIDNIKGVREWREGDWSSGRKNKRRVDARIWLCFKRVIHIRENAEGIEKMAKEIAGDVLIQCNLHYRWQSRFK